MRRVDYKGLEIIEQEEVGNYASITFRFVPGSLEDNRSRTWESSIHVAACVRFVLICCRSSTNQPSTHNLAARSLLRPCFTFNLSCRTSLVDKLSKDKSLQTRTERSTFVRVKGEWLYLASAPP